MCYPECVDAEFSAALFDFGPRNAPSGQADMRRLDVINDALNHIATWSELTTVTTECKHSHVQQ